MCAYLRMIYLAFYIVLFSPFTHDVFICDQISACIPVLRMSRKAKIVFYCHFPDMLLTARKTMLKRIYRAPIDALEQFTTGLSTIFIHSNLRHRNVKILFALRRCNSTLLMLFSVFLTSGAYVNITIQVFNTNRTCV